MNPRRTFFRNLLQWGAGVTAASQLAKAQHVHPTGAAAKEIAPPAAPVTVETLDLADLPFTLDNGVKVFHLTAEPVKRQIAPTKALDLWGYNGTSPGPTIQVNQGDRVRIVFENRLPEPTSMHWHGLEVPVDMDGAPGSSQDPVKPGEKFVYEFPLNQEGTFFYHPHMAMQEMMGMLGAFIIHPKTARSPRVDKDYIIHLQEYAVLPNNTVPNTMAMEFNWLVFNGRSGPAATPLIVRLGDRVRVRLINLGMDHHPIHLHGHTFYVTGTEGGPIPEVLWYPGNTVLVGVAQARDFEFVANNPGDWMLHCHLPHHMMNQMVSNVGPMTRLDRPAMPIPIPGMPHNHAEMKLDVSPDANSVPGFPQDAYMEGPMMAMDDLVRKPQNHGLRPGWSGFMQGMMTFVRVLPPAQYDEVMELVRKGEPAATPGTQPAAAPHVHPK